MSIEELNALWIKIEDERKSRKLRLYLVVLIIGTIFIVKADGIKKKDQGVKDIFEKYGRGDLSYRDEDEDEISFLFQHAIDAEGCGYDIDAVTMQLKKMMTS